MDSALKAAVDTAVRLGGPNPSAVGVGGAIKVLIIFLPYLLCAGAYPIIPLISLRYDLYAFALGDQRRGGAFKTFGITLVGVVEVDSPTPDDKTPAVRIVLPVPLRKLLLLILSAISKLWA